eukprot:COSAG02_NODE_1719_length_11197_cov_12.067039_9_plen_79_part_00
MIKKLKVKANGVLGVVRTRDAEGRHEEQQVAPRPDVGPLAFVGPSPFGPEGWDDLRCFRLTPTPTPPQTGLGCVCMCD